MLHAVDANVVGPLIQPMQQQHMQGAQLLQAFAEDQKGSGEPPGKGAREGHERAMSAVRLCRRRPEVSTVEDERGHLLVGECGSASGLVVWVGPKG